MNVGRPMPWLASQLAAPMSGLIRTYVVCGAVAILWGTAWLPGARYVEMLGWTILAVSVAYSMPRRVIRRMLRARYAQPLLSRPSSERYGWLRLTVLFLAVTSPFFNWPLLASLRIQRFALDRFAHYTHDVRPLLDPPSTPRFVGALAVTEVRVAPNYVELDVLGGGTLNWSPDGPRLWKPWPVASELPWWYRWVGRPISGRWVAEPVDPRTLVAEFIK